MKKLILSTLKWLFGAPAKKRLRASPGWSKGPAYASALLGSLLAWGVATQSPSAVNSWVRGEVTDEEVESAIFSLPTHEAFNVFYLNSKGSDLNAGSTAVDGGGSDTFSVQDIGGAYGQGTGGSGNDRYTAHGGTTPFTGTQIGEWISIYTAAAATTTFIGQITAVGGTGATVDVSLSAFYGTRPANGSTKTAQTGGAWASLNVLTSTGTAMPASTQVNIRGSNASSYTTTYANTSNNRTLTWNATALNFVWFRGYNATLGDLDNIPISTRSPGTNMPQFSWTTGHGTFNGGGVLWSAVSFLTTGASAAAVVTAGGAFQEYHRCRFENQQATAACSALAANASAARYIQCWFKATTTATATITSATSSEFYLCGIEGGVSNLSLSGTAIAFVFAGCTLANAVTQSILSTTTGVLSMNGCTVSGRGNTAVDGFKCTTLPSTMVITNCIFDTYSGTAINNASGGNTNVFRINSNGYWACGAQLAGFGDMPQFDAIADIADPFVAAASLNFTVVPSSKFYGKGAPQLFENQPNNFSFASMGALQPAGGTTVIINKTVNNHLVDEDDDGTYL